MVLKELFIVPWCSAGFKGVVREGLREGLSRGHNGIDENKVWGGL